MISLTNCRAGSRCWFAIFWGAVVWTSTYEKSTYVSYCSSRKIRCSNEDDLYQFLFNLPKPLILAEIISVGCVPRSHHKPSHRLPSRSWREVFFWKLSIILGRNSTIFPRNLVPEPYLIDSGRALMSLAVIISVDPSGCALKFIRWFSQFVLSWIIAWKIVAIPEVVITVFAKKKSKKTSVPKWRSLNSSKQTRWWMMRNKI